VALIGKIHLNELVQQRHVAGSESKMNMGGAEENVSKVAISYLRELKRVVVDLVNFINIKRGRSINAQGVDLIADILVDIFSGFPNDTHR